MGFLRMKTAVRLSHGMRIGLSGLPRLLSNLRNLSPSMMDFAAARGSISIVEAVEKLLAGGRRLGQQAGRQIM